MKRSKTYIILYMTGVITISALVFVLFLRTHINGFFPALFADMVYGTAYKPFVYRTLVPSIVRSITSAIPAEKQTAFNHAISQSRLIQETRLVLLGSRFRTDESAYVTEYAIALCCMYLSLLGFAWAVRYLFTSLYADAGVTGDMISLFALAGLPLFFKFYSYLYDFSNLLLFTAGLALMVRQKWRIYCIVFILACLNKETAILLTMIFIIYCHKQEIMERLLFKRLLMIQLFIFALIKLLVTLVFRNNPGSVVQFHLFDHNLQLLNFYTVADILIFLGSVLLIALLAGLKWSEKPAVIKYGLWIIVPLIVLAMLFGFVEELRDYYEVYPILLILIVHSIYRLCGIKLVKIETQLVE